MFEGCRAVGAVGLEAAVPGARGALERRAVVPLVRAGGLQSLPWHRCRVRAGLGGVQRGSDRALVLPMLQRGKNPKPTNFLLGVGTW